MTFGYEHISEEPAIFRSCQMRPNFLNIKHELFIFMSQVTKKAVQTYNECILYFNKSFTFNMGFLLDLANNTCLP